MKLFLLAIAIFTCAIIHENAQGQIKKRTYSKNQILSFKKLDSAHSRYDNQDYTAAISFCDEAINLYNNNASAYFLRGRLKRFTGNEQQSLRDYDESIRIDYTNAFHYLERGQLKVKIGMNLEALADYEKAKIYAKDNGDKVIIYYEIASFKTSILDWQGALTDCNKSAQYLTTNDFSILFSLRGKVKYEIQDYIGSIKDCDEAISRSPASESSPYYTRGMCKVKLQNREGACDDFTMAYKISKDFNIRQAKEKYCK